MIKMNANNLIRKILLERGETGRGINYNDTYQVLSTAIQKCPTLKGAGVIKQMTQSTPLDDKKQPMITHFREIYNMKPTAVAFAKLNDNQIVFGMVDPQTNSGKRGLYAYTIQAGSAPTRIEGGAGVGCPELQRLEDYGQAPLSDYNEYILSSLIKSCQGTVVRMSQKKPAGNYKRVPVKDLTDCVSGQKLPWEGEPDGYVWKQTMAGEVGFDNNPELISQQLKKEGFTNTQKETTNNLLDLAFKFKAIQKDAGLYNIDPNIEPEMPIYILAKGGVLTDPTPQQCKELVKTLKACKNNEPGVTYDQCRDNLLQRKVSTINCKKIGKLSLGGNLGLEDDFNKLKSDFGKYGLGRLMNPQLGGVGSVVMKESSLEKRINKLLNEEYKKFSFNEPKMSDYKFDQEMIEEIAYRAIVESIFNIQKVAPQLRKINENVLGDVAGAFGSNWLDKISGAGKEWLATKVISMLGFDPTSYFALLFKNIFANLDFDQYNEFLTNCPKFTKVIVKSALEAWLDYAWANNMEGGKDQIGSIVYMALKNMVTETAANTSVYNKLESVAGKVVCPMITGIADSVKSGDINPLG